MFFSGANSGEIQFENGQQFYSVSYEFHYRAETWIVKLLEEGTRAIVAIGNGKFSEISAGDSPKLLVPFPGLAGSCTFTDDPTKAVFTSWNGYNTSTFGDLGLVIPNGQ